MDTESETCTNHNMNEPAVNKLIQKKAMGKTHRYQSVFARKTSWQNTPQSSHTQ